MNYIEQKDTRSLATAFSTVLVSAPLPIQPTSIVERISGIVLQIFRINRLGFKYDCYYDNDNEFGISFIWESGQKGDSDHCLGVSKIIREKLSGELGRTISIVGKENRVTVWVSK